MYFPNCFSISLEKSVTALANLKQCKGQKLAWWMHGVCPDHKWQRTRWKSHMFTVNTAAVCMDGNSVWVYPVYMICGLSWSGSPCDRGWKMSSAGDLQSAIIKPSVDVSRFCWQQAKKGKFMWSQSVNRQSSWFVTGVCHLKGTDNTQRTSPLRVKLRFQSFLYAEG